MCIRNFIYCTNMCSKTRVWFAFDSPSYYTTYWWDAPISVTTTHDVDWKIHFDFRRRPNSTFFIKAPNCIGGTKPTSAVNGREDNKGEWFTHSAPHLDDDGRIYLEENVCGRSVVLTFHLLIFRHSVVARNAHTYTYRESYLERSEWVLHKVFVCQRISSNWQF